MRLLSSIAGPVLVLILAAGPAGAQQSCHEIEAVLLQCADGNGISGDPPSCLCEGIPVDPLILTCEINFGCPNADDVGFGDFPECGCRPKEEIGGGTAGGGSTGGGGDGGAGGIGGVGGGLGGVATCEQFLECPSGSHMEVHGSQCTCTLVMLPAVKE